MPVPVLRANLNVLFNLWCSTTREGHEWRDFLGCETTAGAEELAIEREIFGAAAMA